MGQGEARWVCPVRSRGLASRLMVVVVVFVVVVFVVGPANAQSNCSLNDVMVMANFNSSRMVGRWYENLWIAPTFQDSGSMWANYFHHYSADSFGFVTGYYSGKDPNTGQCFLGRVANLDVATDNQPAKMMQYTHDWKALIDYWVLDTDYESYAIVYSCVQRSQDEVNSCQVARSWLWARGKTLPQNVRDAARDKFRSLCMNMSLLYDNAFVGEDCELETTGTASKLMSSGTPFFSLLLPCLLLNARVVSP